MYSFRGDCITNLVRRVLEKIKPIVYDENQAEINSLHNLKNKFDNLGISLTFAFLF